MEELHVTKDYINKTFKEIVSLGKSSFLIFGCGSVNSRSWNKLKWLPPFLLQKGSGS